MTLSPGQRHQDKHMRKNDFSKQIVNKKIHHPVFTKIIFYL